MQDRMTVGQLYPRTITTLHNKPMATSTSSVHTPGENRRFADLLQDNMVRLSHHAEQRLRQRGIHLDDAQMGKLNTALDKAEQKGAKDTLMLFQNMALIVNVKNRTVVTAMDSASMNEHVFTKIDSAVIVT